MTLQVRHVSKRFGGIPALHDCSVVIPEKGITAIIGPNGAGKTTLFDSISGLSRPDMGKVWWGNEDITLLSPQKRVRKGIVRTFQLVRLFPHMSVVENVIYARKQFSESIFGSLLFWRVAKEQAMLREKALEVLGYVGLESKADVLASELSFGEQKLVELARAIMLDPHLLLLDEPAAGVAPLVRENMKVILQNFARHGIGVCLVEHDMKFVADIADHVIVLDRGREVVSGPAAEVLREKKVLDVYLGRPHA